MKAYLNDWPQDMRAARLCSSVNPQHTDQVAKSPGQLCCHMQQLQPDVLLSCDVLAPDAAAIDGRTVLTTSSNGLADAYAGTHSIWMTLSVGQDIISLNMMSRSASCSRVYAVFVFGSGH